MALNPIVYTEKVVSSFLRYQLTRFPFSDERLYVQMRRLLRLEDTRETPLLQGPFISLSRSFREGAPVKSLIEEEVLHPFLANLIDYPNLYGHQERAIRDIMAGRTTLVSTGTGSGKTECFLYPIISRCLRFRDDDVPAGITAVIVYPMNALAEDQMGRLRHLLAGTGITFGMYVGFTPERSADVAGERLRQGASRADYERALEKARGERRGTAVHPFEERCAREEMRAPGQQPRILVTNVKQLELLLTRQADVELFDNARLEFLVFDEAHTFSGAAGAETACLIRRLRAFCGRGPNDTTCVATSATLADPDGGEAAGRQFAARFFGVDADQVSLVGEEYAEETWAGDRVNTPAPTGQKAEYLKAVLEAVDREDEDAGIAVSEALQSMVGQGIETKGWPETLYDRLASIEVVYQIAHALTRPRALPNLLAELRDLLGRSVDEEEVLAWLALGAAARKEGRPLLRPVVHAFVRGLGGAVVTFPDDGAEPRLWLSAEDERRASGDEERIRLPVLACTSCGQHYFTHHLEDFSMRGAELGGGRAVGDRRYWPSLDAARGGNRVVLVDRVIGSDDEEEDLGSLTAVHLCRICGTLHPANVSRCDGCGAESGLVGLYAVLQREDRPGYLSRCVSCGAPGRPYRGRYREPAREVRAVSVADVHVLAQDMVHNADRKRLLVFADNRQDAAFQAGWMQDHARRFRLRSLMHERIREGTVGIGDLVAWLDDYLDRDDDLSQALIPEVWDVCRKEQESERHGQERRYFLRIQVLRELTVGVKQPIGLEPWGRLKVDYAGLDSGNAFIVDEAAKLGVSAEELTQGIGAFLDLMRRRNLVLHDQGAPILSRFWREGDREVLRGYLPKLQGVPKGLKLCRDPGDDESRVYQWIGQTGHLTNAREIAQSWGVDREEVDAFLERLWKFLKDDLGLLTPVTLRGSNNNALPRCSGVYQIDAEKLRLTRIRESYRCRKCRRTQVRRTPHDRCMGWHCDGTLEFQQENRDSYDLALLDQGVEMIRPHEHSAQVPPEDRDRIERLFKGDGQAINTLVCTPTLELGVDIGTLDTVLQRNMPPLPANYWQRTGRAGRRHRMAVNVTYARPVSHDLVYYANPMKMLEGRVEPPRFNLRNELMVRKHVHAILLTRLYQLARESSGLSEYDRQEIADALAECFPGRIRDYLFDADGKLRAESVKADRLRTVVSKHEADLCDVVVTTFSGTWPTDDRRVVEPDVLASYVSSAGDELDTVIARLRSRLDWALGQMDRLERRRATQGALDNPDDALYQRCKRLVRRLKGLDQRHRQQAEGFDDTNTYAALAAEGYLPGYGLEIGSILGTAQMPPMTRGAREYPLRRPPALALREFVPGNLVYANGQRFTPRYFHREADELTRFRVDAESGSVVEATGGDAAATALGAVTLRAIPICDVDLTHISHISDDEDFRFQMPVAVFGYEQQQWSGGASYRWGGRTLSQRKGVHFRLVNVGSRSRLQTERAEPGFPVCLVCGQSRSPFASDRELEKFREDHAERCGRPVEATGFLADVVADVLTLPDCANHEEAYSVLETLRTAASNVLEMETEDLEILVIGHAGTEQVDALLYDPMPGGSGLLDQICTRFPEVWSAAIDLVDNCPSDCTRACTDCLLRFRNTFFHAYLDRHTAAGRLREWGDQLQFEHDIPAKQPRATVGPREQPTNPPEQILQSMLQAAGFPEPEWQLQLSLGGRLGTTTPDCYFPEDDLEAPGVCIYLDGLSRDIHGDPQTHRQDRQIREELRARGYEVLEIAVTELSDRERMRSYFYRLGRLLLDRSEARRLRDDMAWFAPANTDVRRGAGGEQSTATSADDTTVPFEIVDADAEARDASVIPLLSLKAAAGNFGESMEVEPEAWVRPNSTKRLDQGMFVAQVVGRSMEPKIPDGAYCIFRAPVVGSRTGKILLVEHSGIHDPETGGSYTVKEFDSSRVQGKEGQQRTGTILLKPLNPEFQPIELTDANETDVRVIAELIEVLPGRFNATRDSLLEGSRPEGEFSI